MNRIMPFALGAALLASLACTDRKAENTSAPKAVEADNTGKNERDRDEARKLPSDQLENETDLRITQDVRKSVVDDGALSFKAHNVKIVTANGIVTLRGPVASEVEKASIEAKAKAVAGVNRVDNQLEIAP
jgi:hyperosmotically inducible periplasmic protein